MRQRHLTSIFVLLFIFIGSTFAEEKRPNIIFIMLDDLGKEWVSCYGGENIETPNVDKLAATGMKFNNAYSMPQCTPTRVCLLTGQYPYRNGWSNHWDVPRWGVGYFDWRTNPSIGRVMKSAGYKTAIAGKWQINYFKHNPNVLEKHGFDKYCMWVGGPPKRYWSPTIHTNEGTQTHKGKFGPDIYNQFLLDFITENKDEPFFIYYPMNLPHMPFVTTPLEPNVQGMHNRHKAMIRYADFLTGKLVDRLDKLGLREETIVIWTTDNGSCRKIFNERNGRTVRGGKASTTENGVNTPFIVSCPGTVPSGVVSDAMVDFTDMMPTFADFSGASLEEGYVYDGVSLKDVFTGKAEQSKRKWILAMGSHNAAGTEKGIESTFYFRDRVIRNSRYKLFVGIDRKPERLVDLVNDPEELVDLRDKPEYAKALEELYAPVKTMFEQDKDPRYTREPDYPIIRTKNSPKLDNPSQVHKIGHPDNPNGYNVPKNTRFILPARAGRKTK